MKRLIPFLFLLAPSLSFAWTVIDDPVGTIQSRDTLQSGSTAYPDLLMVGSSATISSPFYVDGTATGMFGNSTVFSIEPSESQFASSFLRNRAIIDGQELVLEIRNQSNTGTHYNAFQLGVPNNLPNWSVRDEGHVYWESVDGYSNFYSSGASLPTLSQKRANLAVLVDANTDSASKPILRLSTAEDATLEFEVHHGSITFGNDTQQSDSVLGQYGTLRDATIDFDGDSLNITANAVTASDDINFTAHSFTFNASPFAGYFIRARLAATDDVAFEMDGTTNDYTGTGGAYRYCMLFKRDLNAGNGNRPTSFIAGAFSTRPKHTDAVIDAGSIVNEGVLGEVVNSATWSLDGGTNKTVTERAVDAVITDTANYDTTGTALLTNYQTGARGYLNLDQTYTDTSTSFNRAYTTGLESVINNNPTLDSGSLTVYNRGISIDVTGTTVGSQYNYGIYGTRVTGADLNYFIWDTSEADWAIDSDNQKLNWGESLDSYVEFDGDSMNIVANNTTATDDMEFTAGSFIFTLEDNAGAQNFMVKDSDGEPVLNLDSNGNLITGHNFQIGDGEAGVDYFLKVDGETNDGELVWEEDEDQFSFTDSVSIESTFTVNNMVITLSTLPITDPVDEGRVWNNQGDLYISEVFSPDQIGGLVNWLKSDTDVYKEDSFTTPVSDGETVGGWKCQSPNLNHHTQGTAAAEPTYSINQLNGYPGIKFDGVDDNLENGSSGLSDDAYDGDDPSYTTFLVKQWDETAAAVDYGVGTSPGDDDSDPRLLMWITAAGPVYNFERNDDANGSPGQLVGTITAGLNYHIFLTRRNVTVLQQWIDGAADKSLINNLGQTTFSRVTLAAWPHTSGPANYADVNFVEVLVYDTKLSSYDTNRVGNYLSEKYGLIWTDVEVAPVYGHMWTNTNQTITIGGSGTPTEIPGGLTVGSTTTASVLFVGAHALQFLVAGKYQIVWDMSTSFAGAPGGGREVEAGIMTNGSADDECQTHRTMANTADTGAMGGNCILTLAVNDQISSFVQNDTNADDIDVEHLNVTIYKIGE